MRVHRPTLAARLWLALGLLTISTAAITSACSDDDENANASTNATGDITDIALTFTEGWVRATAADALDRAAHEDDGAMNDGAMNGDMADGMAETSEGDGPLVTTSAVYGVLTNPGDDAVRLEGVTVPASVAARAEMHTIVTEDDMSRMAPLESPSVPAGGALTFAPGGHHIMLLGLSAVLHPGDVVPVTFTFDGAAPVTLDVPVRES